MRQVFGGNEGGGFDYVDFRVQAWEAGQPGPKAVPVRWSTRGPSVFVHDGDTVTLVGPSANTPYALVNHSAQLVCTAGKRNAALKVIELVFMLILSTFFGLMCAAYVRSVTGMLIPYLIVLYPVLRKMRRIAQDCHHNSQCGVYTAVANKLISWKPANHTAPAGLVEGVMVINVREGEKTVGWEVFRIAVDGRDDDKLVCAVRSEHSKSALRAGDSVRLPGTVTRGRINTIRTFELD
ncbi:hypothetical protein [Massilia sp. TSP1-1-2]|uniref:hypothetical protein n=1 Tax=unclassified Massilia TaxID=2609279 RepID=UPI003CEC1BFA